MLATGACPSCGRVLATTGMLRDEARSLGVSDPTQKHHDDGTPRAPWHFTLMIACLSVYLLWRLVQGVAWLMR